MNIPKNIKNIIFDLGGVILNIDYHLTSKAFKGLGMSNFDEVYSQAKQDNVFNDFEMGKSSAEDFRAYFKTFLPNKTNKELDFAWNAMLLDLPKKRIELLMNIKENYRIFLLSNTNQIHVDKFTSYIDSVFGKGLFESIFENHYYSNEIGFRKPNANAFNYVLKENSLVAEETLFIDDSVQHIEGAKSVGLNTVWLENGKEVTSLFLDKFLLGHH